MRKEINSMCLPFFRNFCPNYLVLLCLCNCISKTAERIFTTCLTIMFQNKSGLNKFNISSKFLQPLCLNLYTNFCLHDLLQAEAGFSLQHGYHSNPTRPNLQHTTNQEHNDQCSISTEQSQAPDDGYIKVRNMFST